ncbi:putative GNAT family N-acyltransferase [Bacillus mesophilus]|uniref:GNAT family N-acetyltransferase n=1 Tax=Bacillus mesophilus TaxID=1808955 RepID=A0A6M0Q6S9_9BACI|nr:GNAT family N-acetyltransferase [Bacillus mesophilus]MBM7661372.1 putative GNAT family N-acyltransferase [Bacillus mesophilus]NEY72045.1 GNAT family N-acetyltransferase [Bacillus mesophilus]
MKDINIIRKIRDNDQLRASFNLLASSTFGISFEEWYQKEFWTEKYDPFCCVVDDQVVANVSVNKLSLIVEGTKWRALQIGTVMTDPLYRNQGLSRLLMNNVLETYRNQYDIMYLFANQTVLNFYPKFGFQAVAEYLYKMEYQLEHIDVGTVQHLNVNNENDLEFIYEFAKNRIPVSQAFSTIDSEELLMFYCLYVFPQHVYYLPEEDVIIVCKQEKNDLHIYDLVSKKEVILKKLLASIANLETETILFHYTPDYNRLEIKKELYRGSEQLFVKINSKLLLPKVFKHPLTSQA